MNDGRAECDVCGEMEPWNWDYELEGLWVCACSRKDSYSVDSVLKKIEDLYGCNLHEARGYGAIVSDSNKRN